MATDGMEFDLSLQTIPVSLKNAETGQPEEYEIRELTGDQRDAYLNTVRKRMRRVGEHSEITDFKGLTAQLLTRSVFRVDTGKAVTEDEVQSWPARVQQALFDKSRELSGLDKEEGEPGEE